MKKILLSNIGNRNLTYKNKSFDRLTDINFKIWTKNLLDNYESEKEFLNIQIIDQLLDHEKFEVVLLYSSNQIHESKQDQDTLFEAEILKKLIEENYKTETNIIENQCRVIDNDALILFYRQSIRTIKKTYPDYKIVVCDAGGTAQQKSALKIILEFFLDENQFEVIYANPANGKLEPVPQLQYRRIIQAEQIKQLIDIGEYKSATKLLGFEKAIDCAKNTNVAIKLLGLGHVLFERQWQYVLPFVKNSSQKQIQHSKLLTRIDAQKSLIENGDFELIFDQNTLFKMGEMLSQIQFYWHKGLFTNAVMQFAIFYETYLYEIISQELGFDLAQNYDTENERLRLEAKKKYTNIAQIFGHAEIKDGIPFKILVSENSIEPCNLEFLKLLKPFISDGKDFKIAGYANKALAVNTIRNKIAHTGKILQPQNIKEELPYFEELLFKTWKLFGVSSSNPYLNMNHFIVENL